MNTLTTRITALLTIAMLGVAGCTPAPEGDAHEEHGAGAADAFERGPHRGRLLRDGSFALELQIYEEGVPPEFHAYAYEGDKPLPPAAVQLQVQLTRLDGTVNRFAFAPQGEALRGDGVVEEPHSFSVVVTATRDGREHRWTYDSFEGRTTIPAATAASAGVVTEAAGPASLADAVVLTGRLVPDQERVRAVSARFAGVVQAVTKSVGDTVVAGERLATVESNESLQVYPVTAPLGGIVMQRHANAGESTGSEPLFVIADHRRLWAKLAVFPRDMERVRAGQEVRLRSVGGERTGTGKVLRVVPAGDSHREAPAGLYSVRVAVDNADGRWTPGLFVEGTVAIRQVSVPLAVRRTGLQGFRDFTVVFEQVGDTYEVRMLELGRQDETWTEVLGGLKPGAKYVSGNSYLIKADIEKSGASHDH